MWIKIIDDNNTKKKKKKRGNILIMPSLGLPLKIPQLFIFDLTHSLNQSNEYKRWLERKTACQCNSAQPEKLLLTCEAFQIRHLFYKTGKYIQV